MTAAVLCVALLGGCSTRQGSKATAVLGAIVIGGGLAVSTDPPRGEAAIIPPGVAVAAFIGLPIALAGLFGMALYSNQPTQREEESMTWAPPPTPPPPAATPAPDARDEHEDAISAARRRTVAEELTRSAKRAARAGDCATVAKRDREVHAIAPDLHATVFAVDVDIKRCLDAMLPTAQTTVP